LIIADSSSSINFLLLKLTEMYAVMILERYR
jgi:hypothetical protein